MRMNDGSRRKKIEELSTQRGKLLSSYPGHQASKVGLSSEIFTACCNMDEHPIFGFASEQSPKYS